MDPDCDNFAICGLTAGGDVFRPSNWAERLATTSACMSPQKRFVFNPMVNLRTVEGINSIVIDKRLVSNDPELFAFFMEFGQANNLIIRCEKQLKSLRAQ